MNYLFKILLFICCTLGGVNATDVSLPEKVLGNPKAPITIIEYSSLTCDHCAEFHEKTLPLLKKNYIDKGHVKLIFREFPSDGWALRAFAIARSIPKADYFTILDTFFAKQKDWVFAKDYIAALAKIARGFGMKRDQVNACINDEKLIESIVAVRIEGTKKFKVDRTPFFIIEGKTYSWALNYPELEKILKPLIKKKRK